MIDDDSNAQVPNGTHVPGTIDAEFDKSEISSEEDDFARDLDDED